MRSSADSTAAPPHPAPHRRLIALLWPERADIAIIVLFSIFTGLLYLASPLAVDAVVNNISFGGQEPVYKQTLLVLALALLVFLVVLSLVSAAQYSVVELIQQRIFVRLAGDLTHRLPRLRYGALERTKRPELVNKFLDVVTVQKSCAIILLDGVNVVLSMLIGLLVVAFYHPFLLVFDLFLILGLVIVVYPLGRNGVRTSVDESYAKHAMAGWFEQVVMFPVLFKCPGAAELSNQRTNALVGTYLTARKMHFRILLRQIVALLALQALASAFLLAIGGLLVLQGELTLGQLVASELIVSAIVASLVSLGKHIENWYDALAATDKLGSIIDLPIESGDGEPVPPADGPLAIDVRNLSFAYENTRPLYEELQFSVAPGERVAVTGPTGAGAGTLLELIFRLRRPGSGMVLLNDIDVRHWKLEDLRRHVSLVREPEIVEGTILENIRLGRPDVSAADAQKALEQVGLMQTVLRLPEGMETPLQPGGRPLSDSQRIRLCFARIILGKPRLILIDKLLDGLDPREAAPLVQALFDGPRDWTLVVATRDEDIRRHCDRVFRLGVDARGASSSPVPPHGQLPPGTEV